MSLDNIAFSLDDTPWECAIMPWIDHVSANRMGNLTMTSDVLCVHVALDLNIARGSATRSGTDVPSLKVRTEDVLKQSVAEVLSGQSEDFWILDGLNCGDGRCVA